MERDDCWLWLYSVAYMLGFISCLLINEYMWRRMKAEVLRKVKKL